jgi:hypothetical protein
MQGRHSVDSSSNVVAMPQPDDLRLAEDAAAKDAAQ